jgi:hypothetical protein
MTIWIVGSVLQLEYSQILKPEKKNHRFVSVEQFNLSLW